MLVVFTYLCASMWTSGIHMLVFNAFTTIKSTIIYYIVANTYIVFALHNELQQDIIHIEKERKKKLKSLFSYWAETHKRIAVQLRRQQIVASIKEVEFFFPHFSFYSPKSFARHVQTFICIACVWVIPYSCMVLHNSNLILNINDGFACHLYSTHW